MLAAPYDLPFQSICLCLSSVNFGDSLYMPAKSDRVNILVFGPIAVTKFQVEPSQHGVKYTG